MFDELKEVNYFNEITDFKSLSLLNCVPRVLKTCSHANVSCVLTANVSCMLTCSRANVPCLLTCSRANMPYVFTCSRANVPCVLACSSANVPCALTGNLPCVLTCRKYQQVFFSSFHLSFFVSQLIQAMPWESQKFNCIVGFCQYLLFFFCYFWT